MSVLHYMYSLRAFLSTIVASFLGKKEKRWCYVMLYYMRAKDDVILYLLLSTWPNWSIGTRDISHLSHIWNTSPQWYTCNLLLLLLYRHKATLPQWYTWNLLLLLLLLYRHSVILPLYNIAINIWSMTNGTKVKLWSQWVIPGAQEFYLQTLQSYNWDMNCQISCP
mgnify:CR=1 FL=1